MSALPEAAIRSAPSGGAVLRVKAVPGASRSSIVGPLGDRLKIALAVPAQKGGANRALELLLAETLNLPRKAITIASGATSPEKEVLISGMDPDELRTILDKKSGGRKKKSRK
ncbi:MAG: DUF167 domain-containing protein [Planctomycetota bacterium]